MQVYIASDHAGFELKQALAAFLREKGIAVEDMGPSIYKEYDDYPDFILPLAKKVAEEKGSFGVAIGASGQGEAMAANRIRGVRAAVYYGSTSLTTGGMSEVKQTVSGAEAEIPQSEPRLGASERGEISAQANSVVTLAREHNDANVLSLGARFISVDEAKSAVELFLNTPFSNEERHIRRIAKLDY